jgi:cytochrome P450
VDVRASRGGRARVTTRRHDDLRERCPVARDHAGHWTVYRHADVRRVVEDHTTFSNVVSDHPAVPNGMDPPEHTAYRNVVAPYFSAERVEEFAPTCRRIAAEIIDGARKTTGTDPAAIDVMHAIAIPFAATVQCAYFGWPTDLAPRLADWVRRNHAATLARDRAAATAVAREFEALVSDLLHQRSADDRTPPRDATEALLREHVVVEVDRQSDGDVAERALTHAEIASVLRNSAMGEVGTIAAAVGIIAVFLAEHPDVQDHLRRHPDDLAVASDEILRLHGPLIDNRRTATCPVSLGDQHIAQGERVSVNWVAANRDPRAFPEAETFRLDRDPSQNLLYGAGIHVCPGALLARLELSIVVAELLAATTSIARASDRIPEPAAYPAAGFVKAWVTLRWR